MASGTALAEVRARRALADAELDESQPLERASSVTNEVWLTERYVIRVNRQPNNRLRREGELASYLPEEVHYPRIVAQGGQPGKDWLILERTPGRPLSRCWPTMVESERRDAARQLAAMLRAVHATREPIGLPSMAAAPQLLDPHGYRAVDPLRAALERARALPHVDQGVIANAIEMVDELGAVLDPMRSATLIHGDLTFENMLWHEGRLTALLDFEWSRSMPADVDLDILLRFCALPFLHVAADYEHLARPEDYRLVPWWVREDYPELFGFRFALERMRLFSLSYDVRELLAYPPTGPVHELPQQHPYRRVRRLLDGQSHLDEFRHSAP